MTPQHASPRPSRPHGSRQRLGAARARLFEAHSTRGLGRRLLAPGVFLLAGALLATSAVNSDGSDLRAGRYGDLASLVLEQRRETNALQERAAALAAEVTALSEQVDDSGVEQVQQRLVDLRHPAGMEPVRGPAVTVTLDDAPEEVIEERVGSGEFTADDLVVHQQDIQAVVNALWAGGAEAMTIQGQRVISTTGIKCVGNTVVLHDIPYSPPYVITAIGAPDQMLNSVQANRYIDIYLQYVAEAELGWDVDVDSSVRLPGYDGPLDLNYARPAGDLTGASGGDV